MPTKKKNRCNRLIAGIDEAGYGPKLGPLCSAVAWMRLSEDAPADDQDHAPDAETLDGVAEMDAVQTVLMNEYNLLIDDSKTVYHSCDDVFRLWLPVALLASSDAREPAMDSETLLSRLCPATDLKSMATLPWYAPGDDYSLTGVGDALKLSAASDRIRERLAALGVCDYGIRVRFLSASAFNARIKVLGNKADLNWELAADGMQSCIKRASSKDSIRFFCDHQGGRKRYAEKLTDAFGGFVWALTETSDHSDYEIQGTTHPMRASFHVRGEAYHPLIALAGMAAKLTREIWMRRFNRYFILRALPNELKPTAGYHNDSGRFLNQIERIISDNRIDLADLIRIV